MNVLIIILFPVILIVGITVMIFIGVFTFLQKVFYKSETKLKLETESIQVEQWNLFINLSGINIYERYVGEIRFGPAYLNLKSEPKIEFLKNSLGEKIIVAIAKKEDEVIGLRAYLYFGDRALDFWATSDSRGRKQYTSFALLWKLFEYAKSFGIQFYDMSGIDPVKGPTVYNFKNGMRCPIKEKIGEWEYCSLPISNLILSNLTSR